VNFVQPLNYRDDAMAQQMRLFFLDDRAKRGNQENIENVDVCINNEIYFF